MAGDWRQVEHTADLALELWAESEPALLLTAAQALVELLSGGAKLPAQEPRPVVLAAVDAADRLVQWCNEVIYQATVHGFFVVDADIHLRGAHGLQATLRGALDQDALQTEIKSATYHDLELVGGPNGWRARVVLDV